MKFSNLLGFSKKNGEKGSKKSVGISGFLLNASEKEKKDIFIKVARKANEEQRATFLRSRADVKV